MKDPYLYRVYTVLSVDDKVVDVLRDADRLSPDRVQGGRGQGRRLAEWPLPLAHRLRAALGQRLARPGRRLSRLDARLHARAVAREQRQLCPLDARFAPAGRLGGLRPAGHRPGLSGGRQGAAGDRTAVGAARRGHARLDDLLPQQPQHFLLGSGQHHRLASADDADGGVAQEMGPPWRPRHGHAR